MADKLGVQLRLEITHMAAGQRTERKRKKDGENKMGGGHSRLMCYIVSA